MTTHVSSSTSSWMRGRHVRGTVLISGPSADCAVGIYVLSAPSREDADALAATDPLAQDDQTSIEVIEWDVHQNTRDRLF